MKAAFWPEAEADVEQQVAYYESIRTGLGLEFLLAVEAAVAAIERTPRRFRVVALGFRRVTLRRFPFTIYYVVEESSLEVSACLHHKRGAKALQSRARTGTGKARRAAPRR